MDEYFKKHTSYERGRHDLRSGKRRDASGSTRTSSSALPLPHTTLPSPFHQRPIPPKMAVFPSRKYRPSSYSNTFAARYRAALARHPFALFGLPFVATMLLGSFFLTPATALRYERHDRKVKQVSKEEELGMGANKRKIDLRDEYYKLAAKDLDNWEQKRVKRLPGEPDGIL